MVDRIRCLSVYQAFNWIFFSFFVKSIRHCFIYANVIFFLSKIFRLVYCNANFEINEYLLKFHFVCAHILIVKRPDKNHINSMKKKNINVAICRKHFAKVQSILFSAVMSWLIIVFARVSHNIRDTNTTKNIDCICMCSGSAYGIQFEFVWTCYCHHK